MELEDLIIKGNKKFKIGNFDASFSGNYKKEDGDEILGSLKDELSDLQEKLYAENKYSVLIIFQAMDAAGKDSAIKHVMSGVNPQGCQVYSFKQPSAEEYDHDFLWRHYKALPEKGRIGIHNRSHYENVLVCKVHPELIAKEKTDAKINEGFWEERYESIRNMEEHLSNNGTVIIKFFLNVSKDEQKERFIKRIDKSSKNWKFSSSDLEERKLWDKYMEAYEDAINKTSTKKSPWHIIPADKKWFSRIAISKIIIERLKELKSEFPKISDEARQGLEDCKKALLNE